MKRCKHGKLKKPRGRRICKKSGGRRGARRSRRRSSRRGLKIAGISVGTLALAAGGAFVAYKALGSGA